MVAAIRVFFVMWVVALFGSSANPLDFSTDVFLASPSALLPTLSTDRIEQERAQWVHKFASHQRRQYVAWGMTACALAVGGAVMWYFAHSPLDDGAVLDEPNMRNMHARDLRDRYTWRHTWQGKGRWFMNKVFKVAAMTVALTIGSRLIAWPWDVITKGYQDFVGDDQQTHLINAVSVYAENIVRLVASLDVLNKSLKNLSGNDSMHHELTKQLVRNVVIDHVACIESTESVVGMLHSLIDAAHDDENRLLINIQQDIVHLIDLARTFTERESAVLHEVLSQAHGQSLPELISLAHGLSNAFLHTVDGLGRYFYGRQFVCG